MRDTHEFLARTAMDKAAIYQIIAAKTLDQTDLAHATAYRKIGESMHQLIAERDELLKQLTGEKEMQNNLVFEVKKLHPLAKIPAQGTPMSAGYDMIACIDDPIILRKSDKAILIPTGLAMVSYRADVVGLLLPRSGLGHKQGLILGNVVGVIDGDFTNEWHISAWNRGQQDEIVINPGDRIAQAVFVPALHPVFMEVDEFSSQTERAGGFGSTGVPSLAA